MARRELKSSTRVRAGRAAENFTVSGQSSCQAFIIHLRLPQDGIHLEACKTHHRQQEAAVAAQITPPVDGVLHCASFQKHEASDIAQTVLQKNRALGINDLCVATRLSFAKTANPSAQPLTLTEAWGPPPCPEAAR